MTSPLAERARRLRELHRPGTPLLLPNVWDVSSARAVEAAGVAAIATTSAGVARSLGYEDGEAMPVQDAFGAVARIAAAVDLPVTADLEAGYGLEAEPFVSALLDAGAVGCNLEDTDHRTGGRTPLERQAEWIAEVVEAAARRGVEVVVNARVDCFLDGARSPERLEEAIRRGRAYRAAGAACVYPILAAAEEDLGTFVRELSVVNVLHFAGAPSPARLRELGVARISLGPNLAREAEGWITGRARALREELE